MSTLGVAPTLGYRESLWDSLLDADMNVQFWTLQSDRYAAIDKWLRIVIALAASGTVAGWSIWAQHAWAWKLFSGIAAVLAIAGPIFFPSSELKRMSELVPQWKAVLIRYELLWGHDRTLSTQAAQSQFESARKQEIDIDETRLPKKKGLILKAWEMVCQKRGLEYE